MKKARRRYQVWQLYKFAELLRPDYFVSWYNALQAKENPDGVDFFRSELDHFAEYLPFLKPLVKGMHGELPALKILAEQHKATPLRASNLFNDYWKVLIAKGSVDNWCKATKLVALIPASSADVERMVSVFTDVIGDDQFSAMESTIEARVKLRFNNRKPKPRKQKRFYDDGAIESDEERIVVEEGVI
jgi:hypothetical protein